MRARAICYAVLLLAVMVCLAIFFKVSAKAGGMLNDHNRALERGE